MCVQSFQMVNIDVPTSVGAPSLDIQTLLDKTVERAMTQSESLLLCMFNNSVNVSPVDEMHMLGVVRIFMATHL